LVPYLLLWRVRMLHTISLCCSLWAFLMWRPQISIFLKWACFTLLLTIKCGIMCCIFTSLTDCLIFLFIYSSSPLCEYSQAMKIESIFFDIFAQFLVYCWIPWKNLSQKIIVGTDANLLCIASSLNCMALCLGGRHLFGEMHLLQLAPMNFWSFL